MSQYTTYEEFLNHSYRKILEACLADQAIDTLKILENKDYLLLRVNELFSEIYVAEREKTIQEQANLISTLQKTQQGGKKKEEKCLNCELMGEHVNDLEAQLRELEKKINTNESAEEKSVKKIESMLLKEIQQLKRDLKEIQEENLYKKMEFEEEMEKYLEENKKLKSLLKEETEKSEKLCEKLRARVKQVEQEKQNLEDQVFSQLQSRGKEEKDIRQLNSKCTNLMITRERQQSQITLMKNQNNILQEKLKRLEEENQFAKEKNSIAERQIKSLKKAIEQTQQECGKLKGKIQENVVNEEPYSLESINKKSEIQRRSQESEKYIQALKQELAEKQAQFSEATVQNQKTILKLNDELRKAQIKLEKQLRNAKQEHKRVLSKTTEEIEVAMKQQKEEIVKRYEKSLEEKQLQYQRSQEKIAALDRALTESQQSSNDAFKEFQKEKARLTKQIQQQRHNFIQLKKYYNSQKATEQLIEKENNDKYEEILAEKRQVEKIILLKEKEIRDFKKEILKVNELQSSLLVKIEDYKNKLAGALKNSEEQKTKSKIMAEKLRQKEKSYHDIQIKYTELLEESQDADKKLASFAVNERRLQEKIRRLENQLAQKRELLLSMHEANQQQVIDVFAKAQQTTSQARKQLESYYLNLLKTSEERNSKASSQEIQRLQEEELARIKIKAQDCQEKLKRFKQKNLEQQKQKVNNQTKIYALIQENQQLKSESNKTLQLVQNEKKKNLNIIRAYQQKMLQYYNNFGEFKREFYLSLKQQLTLVKAELLQIGEAAKLQKAKFQQYINDFSEKMLRESQILAHKHQLELERLKHQYEYDIILKIEEQKRQLKVQCEIRLKEQSMEFYTIMAEKQHQINTLTDKETRLQKKVNELEVKNDHLQKISRETFKKNEELKDIISKMSSKIAESDRACSSLQGQLDYYKRSNIELKKQISQLETGFKQKIQECREKYSAQNERLFAKYEKQFSKFIVSNKKSLEFSMLSNSCSNFHVPTKGATEGKLDKIQRQIEEQKKKLNLLEKDGKFDKTKKLVVEKDQPRNEKQRKY